MKIADLIKSKEDDFLTGTQKLGKYVDISLHEIIETIIAYLNSKHISGDKDILNREKPFFNIVTGAVNIWYRATDIDRKNIRVKATKAKDETKSFIATILLQDWMRKSRFGVFLNEWGRTLAQYGSAVSKFVERDGELIPQIIPWNRIIVDGIDFENNVVIEKLYLTASQLRANPAYDQNVVEDLIKTKSKISRQTVGREQVDNNADYFEVYEAHGNLSLKELTGKEKDELIYVPQMHVYSYLVDKDERKDFNLYAGREAKSPYLLSHLIKEEGRTLGIGAVEHLFEAQWMVNHSIKAMKDQLDLASKMFFQTADASFAGNNALNNIETGDILIHDGNEITQVNAQSHDLTSIQNFSIQWQNLAKELTSTPDAIRGNSFPSGTAYKQVALLNQEANSLFELMTENKGLAIEEMLRVFVIPFLKKKMDTTDEISVILDSHNITKLDTMYLDAELIRRKNSIIKEAMFKDNGLGGEVAQPFDMQSEAQKIQSELNSTGNQRFIKPSDIDSETWKEALKDLEWELEVEVTNETTDKQAVFTTLTALFETIVGKQGQPFSPEERLIFNKILEESGRISSIELNSVADSKAVPQQTEQPKANTDNLLAGLTGK